VATKDDAQCVRITLTSTGSHDVLVVARCMRCNIVASRLVEDGAYNLAAMVGAEALVELGCTHVEAVTLTRRKTLA
jgi:hypothetical protein